MTPSHPGTTALSLAAAIVTAVVMLVPAAAAQATAPAADGRLMHVRIDTEAAAVLARDLQDDGFDVLHASFAGGPVQLIVNQAEADALRLRGHTLHLVARGRPYREIEAERAAGTAGPGDAVPAGYPDLSQIMTALAGYETSYPSLCEIVDLTTAYGMSPTVEGNHLYAAKISDNVAIEEDEPTALIVSCHHSRELVTPVLALEAIDRLLAGYGHDPRITPLVDAYEIWIAPCWNPDGYEHVFDVDNMWRKNRRVFDPDIGVDLNRNYPFGWDAICSGSTLPSSSTYKGPSAGSEIETQTMLALSNDRHFAKVLDYHSAGREVLWEYNCSSHPLASFLQTQAILLSTATGYGGDERAPSAEGEHYEWQLAMHGSLAFLTETALQFQPTHAEALAEADLVWPGVTWMLGRPLSMSGHVTDACTGAPVVADVEVLGLAYVNGETNRSGGPFGRYHLFLPGNTYTVNFSAPGYVSRSVPLTVAGFSAVVQDVALVPHGCWLGLGHALAGTHGEPLLTGSGTMVAGEPVLIELSNALENAVAYFVVGIARLDFFPFYGGTLVPDFDPPGFYLPLITDGSGDIAVSGPWPAGIPPGFELYFQYWIEDGGGPFGFAASNAMESVAP